MENFNNADLYINGKKAGVVDGVLSPQDQINKAIYYKAFFAYGLLPLLLLLDDYEEEARFDECMFIKLAIDDVNKAYNSDLPTRWCKDAVEYIKGVYEDKNLDFEAFFKDLPNVMQEVEDFVANRRKDYGLNSIKNDLKQILNIKKID